MWITDPPNMVCRVNHDTDNSQRRLLTIQSSRMIVNGDERRETKIAKRGVQSKKR